MWTRLCPCPVYTFIFDFSKVVSITWKVWLNVYVIIKAWCVLLLNCQIWISFFSYTHKKNTKRCKSDLKWRTLRSPGIKRFGNICVFSGETHLAEFLSTLWWIIVIIGNDNILMWLSSHLSVAIKAAQYSETVSFC